MKRSQAIEKIEEHLLVFIAKYRGVTGACADAILKELEEAGMTPPSMSLPTKALLFDKEINVGNITTVRMWEPEDETK